MDDKAIVAIGWSESSTVEKLLKDYSSLRKDHDELKQDHEYLRTAFGDLAQPKMIIMYLD